MKKNTLNLIMLALAGIIGTAGLSCKKSAANPQLHEAQAAAGNSKAPVSETLATYINTSAQKETGFENGSISPFYTCTTQNPNYGQAFNLNGTNCMKFFWTQSGYDGTRMDRGAEACSSLNIFKEGWFGFNFNLPSAGFPSNKSQTIAQIFANGGCASWAGMLEVINNELWLVYRSNCGSTATTRARISGSIQRNAWKDVVIHFKASRYNTGLIEVWYAGAGKSTPTYRAANIDFAFGNWSDDTLSSDSPLGLKFGMYNYDDGNYTAGETRTLYFDNVSQISGNPSDAFEQIKN